MTFGTKRAQTSKIKPKEFLIGAFHFNGNVPLIYP
nr:MAG TPA: hypothetical protein [Caudoviricetes sp.]